MAGLQNDITCRNWRHLVCFYDYDQKAESRDTPQYIRESVILVEKMKMLIFSFRSCRCAPLVSGSQKIHYRYYRECIANIVNVLLIL